MINPDKLELVAKMLAEGPVGVRKIAASVIHPLKVDPLKAKEELIGLVPSDRLRDVVFAIAAEQALTVEESSPSSVTQLFPEYFT
jgi:hypothetical protein